MSTYRAQHVPRHRGVAAWNAILGDAPKPRALQDNLVADVTIIGAGFAGLSAARRLRQIDANCSIAVLEAGRIAEGAAGRNSGFMIDLPHELASTDYAGSGDDRHLIDLNRRAIAFAQSAVAEYQINPAYFDPCGKVNGAASAKALAHNKSYARHLSNLGESSEMLDAKDMADMTGSAHYLGGLYTSGTVMLQPAGYIRGLAAGLAGEGVDVFENSAVNEFERKGDGWRVKTASGTVSTGTVILTVNGHLESFGVARDALMQLFLFAVMTPELSGEQRASLGGVDRWGITPSDPMGTTVRRINGPQGGNRIVTRTVAVLRPDMEATSRDLNRAARTMQRKFDQRFPQLSGLQMEYAWAGHLCLTRNSVSYAREIDRGVYSGCVQNGLGTARGTLTGIAAAELACGTTSPVTTHFLKEAMPKPLPPRPLREFGANAYLRLKEWQARQE